MNDLNCNPLLTRYLCFTDAFDGGKIQTAKSLGATDIIVRKHSTGFEVDFRFPQDPNTTNLPTILGTGPIIPAEGDLTGYSHNELVAKATKLIAGERFWECHNCLEELWKRSTGDRKKLFHDIIGVVVSQIKAQMGQWDVGKTVFVRSYTALKEAGTRGILKQLPLEFTYPMKFSLEETLQAIEP